MEIDATSLPYQELNRIFREYPDGGPSITVKNVFGQRYLGAGLEKDIKIAISGTPGNDLGAFMSGPDITVYGNAQDGCGNTMDDGRITIYGSAMDVAFFSARGGTLMVRNSVGYRAGIHMKGNSHKRPLLVIGDTAQDFLGEYMAGGVIVLLGLCLKEGEGHPSRFIGAGMHGGVIYISGRLEGHQIAKEVTPSEVDNSDLAILEPILSDFAERFGYPREDLLSRRYLKLLPRYLRPYGRVYGGGDHAAAPGE